MKILIVRLSALGDVLHCLPSLHALRAQYPDATLGWVVEALSAPLLRAHPMVDELFVLPRKNWQRRLRSCDLSVAPEAVSFFRKLRGAAYDVAIDFQGNFRSGWVTGLSGATTRIGHAGKQAREFNSFFTTEQVPLIGSPLHKVDRNLQLLKPLGITDAPPDVTLPVDRDAADAVAPFLKSLSPKKKMVVLHPGASRFGDFKRWPEENYVALGRAMADTGNLQVVVTWGPEEEALARRVVEGIGSSAQISLPTTLPELVELLRAADLLICGDTGPMNVAPLVDTPSVTLFGPKDPAIYAPRDNRSHVVTKSIPCRPCGLRRCSVVWCMSWITPEEVLQPALQVLNR